MKLPNGYEKGYALVAGPSLTFLYYNGEPIDSIRSVKDMKELVNEWVERPWVCVDTVHDIDNYLTYKMIRRA